MAREASENWWRSFAHVGSICADCKCGRTVWAGMFNDGDGEPGERQLLERNTAEFPDKYACVHGDDSVSIAATGHVWGCTCGGALKIQEWLDEHRLDILAYFKRELAAEKFQTGLLADAVNGATDRLKPKA